MTKHVVIVVQNCPIERDRRVLREAVALLEYGFRVSVICPDLFKPVKNGIPDAIEVYRFQVDSESNSLISYLQEYFQSIKEIARICFRIYKKTGFDILQVCNPPDIFFMLGAYFRLRKVKFVFDQHDPSPEIYLSRFTKPNRLLYRLLRWCEYWSYKTANVVLVTNETARKSALVRGALPEDRVFVVRNGPFLTFDSPNLPDPKLKYGHQFMVCCMGGIALQDGVENFLLAARYILEHNQADICFVIVGDGPDLARLRTLASSMDKAATSIIFTGYIYDTKLLEKYILTADICVSPESLSLCNRGMTFIKILDYMAGAKPIVAFDLPETRYSAQDAALYALPNDPIDMAAKIMQLIEDPNLREVMGTKGRSRVQTLLRWEHSRPNLLKAYRQLG